MEEYNKEQWAQVQIDIYSKGRNSWEADTTVERKLGSYCKLLEVAEQIEKERGAGRFLDLGTNCGRVAWEMKQRGWAVLGVDLPEVIEGALKYNIETVGINLEETFPEGQWDIIFIREVFEHLHNYKEILDKMMGSLVSGGYIIMTAPCTKGGAPKRCKQHVRTFEDNSLKEVVVKVVREGEHKVEIKEEGKENRGRSKWLLLRRG